MFGRRGLSAFQIYVRNTLNIRSAALHTIINIPSVIHSDLISLIILLKFYTSTLKDVVLNNLFLLGSAVGGGVGGWGGVYLSIVTLISGFIIIIIF